MDIIPITKLKAILKYFCENTDPRFLGKVKLMKLFYYLDFTHVKKYGSPVTYDRYYNLEHGPIPSVIKNLVYEVDDNSDDALLADTIKIEKSEESWLHRITCTKKFSETDRKYFTPTELEVLEEVCRKYGDKNQKYVEDQSHHEAPWLLTNYLDEIPYELAAKDNDCKVSKEEIVLMLSLQS